MTESEQHDKPAATDKSPWRTLVMLLLVTVVVRGGVLIAQFDNLSDDPDAYRRLAETTRVHGVYGIAGVAADGSNTVRPSAFRPPLYPLLLASLATRGEVSNTAVAILHLLLGLGTVVLTYGLAHVGGLDRRAIIVACVLVACDPILLNQSTVVMTETLATFVAAAALLTVSVASRKNTLMSAASAGAILGLASLCRPTFLPWLGLCCVGYCVLKRSDERRIQLVSCFVIAAAIVLSPWVTRNYVVLGKPKLTTTHGGYTILLGNNPSFYRYLRERDPGKKWDPADFHETWRSRDRDPATGGQVRRDEFEEDRYAYDLALGHIRDDVAGFSQSCVERVRRLWQLAPYPAGDTESSARRLVRLLIGVWYSGLFLAALSGMWVLGRRLVQQPWLPGLLLCLVFTAVHTLYWSNMRMRAPLIPVVCLLAAVAVNRLLDVSSRRK